MIHCALYHVVKDLPSEQPSSSSPSGQSLYLSHNWLLEMHSLLLWHLNWSLRHSKTKTNGKFKVQLKKWVIKNFLRVVEVIFYDTFYWISSLTLFPILSSKSFIKEPINFADDDHKRRINRASGFSTEVEQKPCNQEVVGSNPAFLSSFPTFHQK